MMSVEVIIPTSSPSLVDDGKFRQTFLGHQVRGPPPEYLTGQLLALVENIILSTFNVVGSSLFITVSLKMSPFV